MLAHRRGHLITRVTIRSRYDRKQHACNLPLVSPRVNTEDLIDAHAVAEMLGLSHRNSVSVYLRRYARMPRPVIDLGPGRPRLWVREEVRAWAKSRQQSKPGSEHER